MLLIILIWIVGISGASGKCSIENDTALVLQGKEGRVDFSSTSNGNCIWKYNATAFDGFFLKLTTHSNLISKDNKCTGDVRPTGIGREMRTCSWEPPACYFFTKTKESCISEIIFQRRAACTSITWAIKDDLYSNVSFWSGNNGTEKKFTFHYEYLQCEAEASKTTTNIAQSTNLGTFPCYSSSSSSTDAETTASFARNCEWTFISFVAAAFYASLFVILIVILIVISKQNRMLKKVYSESSKIVSRHDEICRSSARNVSTSVCNNETGSLTDSQENVYDKLQLDGNATESSGKKPTEDPLEVTNVASKSCSKGEKEIFNEGKNGDDEPMYENTATAKISSDGKYPDDRCDNLCRDIRTPTQKVSIPLDRDNINQLIRDRESKQTSNIEGARPKDSCQVLNTEQRFQTQKNNAELVTSGESAYTVAVDDVCHVHATEHVKGPGIPGHNRLLLRRGNDGNANYDSFHSASSPSSAENYSIIKTELAYSNSYPTAEKSLYDEIDRK